MSTILLDTNDRVEVWGGIEATVNRVGNDYFDQLRLTGHHDRLEDLDRLAALGLQTVRYPVLWERVCPMARGIYDWEWSDSRLGRLAELGIDPIVGLVHHGSGPRWTSLVDHVFPEAVAEFAAAVATRYPWVRRFTVINEPLTTARFSGLYGLWYPHARDDATFCRALINQCLGTVLAMEAIRQVTPSAQLVQTEDIGRTEARRRLTDRARFYNHRRWLSFDLLCGRVKPDHPLYTYMRRSGIAEHELQVFVDRSCPPDVLGLNYYVTSDRYLDDRLDRYPAELHDLAPPVPFVDVEAVRTPLGLTGHLNHIVSAWQRYGLPIAITEVHLGCSREEQLRWLAEAWRAANTAREEDIPVRAITVWSLFGAVDWDSLLTRSDGHYETGAFDVRGGECRPTAVAAAVSSLIHEGHVTHPAARGPGWWRRINSGRSHFEETTGGRRRPLLIAHGPVRGAMAEALAAACDERGLPYRMLLQSQTNLANPALTADAINVHQPWAVINAAGYVDVEGAEHDTITCWRENVSVPKALASATASAGLPFVTFSSDLVFDGATNTPYLEADDVRPLSVYGRSKAAAEVAVLDAHSHALVIRSSPFFDLNDQPMGMTNTLRRIASGRVQSVPEDTTGSPTYGPDLASQCLDLLIDGAEGIWHVVNEGGLSTSDLLRAAVLRLGLDAGLIRPCRASDLFRAPRPPYSVLASRRGVTMRPIAAALECYTRVFSANTFR